MNRLRALIFDPLKGNELQNSPGLLYRFKFSSNKGDSALIIMLNRFSKNRWPDYK